MTHLRHTSRYLALVAALVAILATSCAPGDRGPAAPTLGAPPASVVTSRQVDPSGGRSPSIPVPNPSATRRPPSSPKVQPIGWDSTVSVIDAKTRARMRYSWRRGCPVRLKDLRLVTMTHWGFDGAYHIGEMVLHRRVVDDVLKVFRKMFDARFPIRRMRLVDVYRGDDDRSMAADNTSAFNCRKVTGGSDWSQHSYGWAIDINPVENPYVSRGGRILPPSGERYADRSRRARGMIHRGDLLYRAFISIGWGWGGNWGSIKDYQHFSLTGR
jgi:D-alanyl-D-alanine carboxypeptidase